LWDAKLLRHNKAPDGQLVDFQPSDPRATDCQSADGKCTEGYGADRNCAKRKPAYGERTGCNRTKRSWGSAYRFHASQAVDETTSFGHGRTKGLTSGQTFAAPPPNQ